MTRGEAIIAGIERMRSGLELVRQAGSQTEVLTVLVGSSQGGQKLREVMKPGLLRTIIVSMVASRNSRLSHDTVEKVVDDFITVLFDLSKPLEALPSQKGGSADGC